MRLFVYGSLKRGEYNHEAFLAGQTFLGPARTPPRFRLYDLGRHPALVADVDGVAVAGELWDIDAACLERLDRLEGLDEGEYARVAVTLADPAVEAYVYLYQRSIVGCRDCGGAWTGGAS